HRASSLHCDPTTLRAAKPLRDILQKLCCAVNREPATINLVDGDSETEVCTGEDDQGVTGRGRSDAVPARPEGRCDADHGIGVGAGRLRAASLTAPEVG